MKKILLILLVLSLLIPAGGCIAESTFDVGPGLDYGVKFYDRMLERHYDNAIPYQESEIFDVHYCVQDNKAEEKFQYVQEGDALPRYRSVYIEYSLRNKTSETLSNCYAVLHGNLSSQYLSIFDSIHHEPHDMGPYGSKNPNGVSSGASFWVDLSDVTIAGGVTLDTFYDVLIEVCWDEGEELLLVTSEDLQAILQSEAALDRGEDYVFSPIEQEDIDEMNQIAYEWFKALYPEDYEQMKEDNEPRTLWEYKAE